MYISLKVICMSSHSELLKSHMDQVCVQHPYKCIQQIASNLPPPTAYLLNLLQHMHRMASKIECLPMIHDVRPPKVSSVLHTCTLDARTTNLEIPVPADVLLLWLGLLSKIVSTHPSYRSTKINYPSFYDNLQLGPYIMERLRAFSSQN